MNIVIGLQGANSVHNSSLLPSLPLPETAYISRLDKMGLVGRELNSLNTVHFSLENKLRIPMTLGPAY